MLFSGDLKSFLLFCLSVFKKVALFEKMLYMIISVKCECWLHDSFLKHLK